MPCDGPLVVDNKEEDEDGEEGEEEEEEEVEEDIPMADITKVRTSKENKARSKHSMRLVV